MRWVNVLFCYLFLAFTFAGVNAPLLASDVDSPRQTSPDDGPDSGDALQAQEVAEFCHGQRRICRKICDLRSRFEDRFDGCPQSCESREGRCTRTGCYRWTDREFLIAERFGGYQCHQ